MTMQGERMLGNDKVCLKNARNRQFKVKECWQMAMYAEKMLGIQMYTEKILEIHNIHRKSARNRQCKVQEYSETSM